MINIKEDYLLLLRNLKDAGCNEETINKYFQFKEEGREKEQYRLLSLHRAQLLDKIHTDQKMIDCLDYLIYSMKNKKF